jgi:hypothetical protein
MRAPTPKRHRDNELRLPYLRCGSQRFCVTDGNERPSASWTGSWTKGCAQRVHRVQPVQCGVQAEHQDVRVLRDQLADPGSLRGISSRVCTAAARQISAASLGERLALTGPL